MVVSERKRMETAACSSGNGWSLNPLTTSCYGKVDAADDTWMDRIPVIVPCYNGKTLPIHEELVVNGLSAISIKHHKGCCTETTHDGLCDVQRERSKTDIDKELKEIKGRTTKLGKEGVKMFSTTGLPVCLGEKMKRRNSFWNMHRPELSKLTWPQKFISSTMLQDFFHHHLRTHGTFCEPLHVETEQNLDVDEDIPDYTLLREIVPPTVLPPDEKPVNIMEKSRSVQLNDEDLDPEIMVHKSRAEFCVTIGEYMRKPPLKRSTSEQTPKSGHSVCRLEPTQPQRETLISKEEVNSEEVFSSVISNSAGL
ncbi:UNVERIFIED_CONTAM: hypothetical protein PYX00_001481 [Menopon gallinae]|uniref:Uncharacterized protein n=1 Tax=Menopon gallinae TaxID=328185 RepID=A0AAW2ICY2_9NEOP